MRRIYQDFCCLRERMTDLAKLLVRRLADVALMKIDETRRVAWSSDKLSRGS